MRNKANLLFIAVIAIPFYSFSSTITITNLHTMQLQQQISRNAAVNSGVTTNHSKSVREAAIKWSADPNMTLQSIFIDVLWLNFPIFSQKSALCC